MRVKIGFVLSILIIFLFTVVSINAQSDHYWSVEVLYPTRGSFWIYSVPFITYHSSITQRWSDWTNGTIINSASGRSFPGNIWVNSSGIDLGPAVFSSNPSFETQENEFDYGYLAAWACCDVNGQCPPRNDQSILHGGGSQTGQWLCGWAMRRVNP